MDDHYTSPEDARLLVRAPGVRANDADPEGTPLTVRMVRKPRHGTATLSKKGRLRYVPDADWSGTDRLVYVPPRRRRQEGPRSPATSAAAPTPSTAPATRSRSTPWS